MSNKKSLKPNGGVDATTPIQEEVVDGKGVDIGLIMSDIVTKYIKFGSREIWVKFRPNLYTPKLVEKYAGVSAALTMIQGGMLLDWDLVYTPKPGDSQYDKNNPNRKLKVPITEEGMMMLPIPVVNTIWDELLKCMVPNLEDREDSMNTGSFA